MLLTEDLTLLSHQWIVASHMQVNVNKSSVMWFYIKQSKRRAPPPPVYLGSLLLQQVNRHKYLGVIFDPQLRWDVHVANVCRKMSYYLYLISYHRRQLPPHTQDVDECSCIVPVLCFAYMRTFSGNCCYVSPLQSCTCGLQKYDHVSAARHNLGWLPFDSLVQYRALALMYRHYIHDNCVQLDPPLQFGSNHAYGTRQSSHFFGIQLLLDRNFSDRKLQHGGTVFLVHCLTVVFRVVCINIYLICDVYMFYLFIIFLLYCVCSYVVVIIILLYRVCMLYL